MPLTTYAFSESEPVPNAEILHRIVFVVPDGLNAQDNDLLRRIAAALKADPDQDIAYLVSMPGQPATIPSAARSAPELLVSFGVSPESFGWHVDLAGQGMCALDRTSVILTVSPRLLQADAQAKKNLWAAMQDHLDRSAIARR